MKRVKYLNNRDLLAQIHASKNTYCSYVTPEDADYDIIVSNLKKINVRSIAEAKKARAKRMTQEAWEQAKESGEKKIKLADYTISPRKIDKTDLVFRVMMFDHVPMDDERKRNPKSTADHHSKVNFPPFQHYRIDRKGKLKCVGKSHWIGGMDNGHFSADHGKMTNQLALMYMKLCERYGTRANWRGYTYNDEMQSQALMQLSQIGLQFDESKSDNPFAYYTAAITNSFTRILNIEKKNQAIRDDLLEFNGMMPSFTRQNENDTSTASYKKKMKTVHGDVHEVNKTGLAKLNKALRKKGRLDTEDFDEVKFKNKIDMTNHKPVVKKKW
jgi:ribosomal protein S20